MDEPDAPGTVRWLLVVAVAVVLAVAAVVRPGQGVGELGPFGLLTLDLWLHAVGYAALQAVVIFALVGGRRPPATPVRLTPVATVSYGLLLEGVQFLLSYRSFSVADAIANAAGILAVLLAYELLVAAVPER